MILNNAAYHLQQAVEKILKAALECVGVTVPNTHKITRLLSMITANGAGLVITDWIDDHSEMLSEWEAETRYNMDFIVEKRKLYPTPMKEEMTLEGRGGRTVSRRNCARSFRIKQCGRSFCAACRNPGGSAAILS